MENETIYSQAIFWIDIEKIKPNPYQPRKEFDEQSLISLADSIRQYGVLQPLVVTRQELQRDDGGISVHYELIAGERRLRASKLAGVREVPVLIRDKEDNDKAKLEIAIIENLQREDLNPIERARAFLQLNDSFGLSHTEISKKIGKSREYVSNTIRILALPDGIQLAVQEKRISEGHARAILMLNDRPSERDVMFNDILTKGMTVREAEMYSRRIAHDKIRKPTKIFDIETRDLERKLAEHLGTRVWIEKKDEGGKILIEFFTPEELHNFLSKVSLDSENDKGNIETEIGASMDELTSEESESESESESEDEDLYSIRNFSI